MILLISAAASSGSRYMATDSASVGADMRAIIEAIAGAVAIRKPAEVKNIEKAEIVSMRRKRARRRGGDEEATWTCQSKFWIGSLRKDVLRLELYGCVLGGYLSKSDRRIGDAYNLWPPRGLLRRNENILQWPNARQTLQRSMPSQQITINSRLHFH